MPVESKGSKPSLPRASGGVEDQKADEWMPQKNHKPSALHSTEQKPLTHFALFWDLDKYLTLKHIFSFYTHFKTYLCVYVLKWAVRQFKVVFFT